MTTSLAIYSIARSATSVNCLRRARDGRRRPRGRRPSHATPHNRQFSSVRAGRSQQDRHAPVSEKHDDALANAFQKMIFLDTSAMLTGGTADPNHHAAVRRLQVVLDAGEELLTHNYVLVESLALLQARLGVAAALNWPRIRRRSSWSGWMMGCTRPAFAHWSNRRSAT